MPTFTGNVKSFTGSSLASQVAQLGFRLCRPSMVVAGASAGTVIPTIERWVTPNSDGEFSVILEAVTAMHDDAWYIMTIQWNDEAGTLKDFPEWQFRPGASGGSIEDIIYTGTGGLGPGPNLSLVLISTTQPPQLKVGQLWLNPETGDLYRGK